MRTAMFTGFDAKYEPLAAITVPRMQMYAAVRGWHFQAFITPPPGLSMYWTSVVRGLELLEFGFDRVVYLDSDQLITNPSVTFQTMQDDPRSGFHVSQDWGADATEPHHFSMCGFVGCHHDAVMIFREAIRLQPEFANAPFPEQDPMREVMRRNLVNGFHVHRRLAFNNVPDEVCPGKVPEPWTPTAWCCHLTMLPVDERVVLAKKILATL